ncbi:MAG: TetR/AcrR family transcriptional regulator [Reyranellales bacterium]
MTSPNRKPTKVDGRRQRSERTKQLIVEAYIALVREKPQIPTATQIAERAGYSVRSVFERFPDLHVLRVAAVDHATAQRTAQGVLREIEGDRQTRINTSVRIRAQGCESWLPMWRVLNANQGESEELKERIRRVRQLVMMRFEATFKPELSTLSEVERRRTTIAFEALSDFESWGRMREFYGLSFDEACGVWASATDRLLPPTPADS